MASQLLEGRVLDGVVASAADLARGFDRLIRLALPRFADAAIVDVLQSDGTLLCVYAAHRLEEKDALVHLELGRRPSVGSPRDQAGRQGRPLLVRGVEELESFCRDEAHVLNLRRWGLRSVLAVPISVDERLIGALAFGITEPGRDLDESDLAFAGEVARQISSVARLALIGAEERLLRAAAQRASERMTRLQEITSALSRAPDRVHVADEILRHGREALGAEAGLLAVLDRSETVLEVLRAFATGRVVEGFRVPIERELPLATAVRLGEPILLRTPEEIRARFPLFEKNAHVHPGGLAAVPLMVEGRRLGALQLCFAEGRHPQDLDADFLMTVAGLTAQALERAKLFDDVERSEQLLRTLAEVADQQVWVEGPGDKLEYINSRACQYIGVPEEELRAMGARALCARIWDPDDLRAHAAQMQDAPRDQKMEIFVRLRRADGAYRSHLIRVVPLPDASGAARRWVGTATDVEQLLQAQAALRDKQAEEHRFRELLLGIVGHDLRNPLAAIGSWVQVLQVHPDVAQQDEALARIDRTLARMRRMIAQLLDFTHARQTGTIPVQPRPADLGAICRAVVDELSSASGGRLWLEATGDLAGKWDPDRLAQLVSNLAGNSLQHGDGGRVELRVTGAGDEVLVEVHNRGPVIAGSELAHLFDPYRRGRAATTQHGSLGLGLYIVQRIVHAHGGSIAVTSTAEAGTTFRVRLPRINTG